MQTPLRKNTENGSAEVEAAVVLPVLFMIVALIISVTVRTAENVASIGSEYETETEASFAADPMLPEEILRVRWAGIK